MFRGLLLESVAAKVMHAACPVWIATHTEDTESPAHESVRCALPVSPAMKQCCCWAMEPQIYVEGILKICEVYLESPLQCVAGVTGANLRR